MCVALTNVLDLGLDELWSLVEHDGIPTSPDVAPGATLRPRHPHAWCSPRARNRRVDQGMHHEGPPAEIAQEITGDLDLLTAFGHLMTALSDSSLRTTVNDDA